MAPVREDRCLSPWAGSKLRRRLVLMTTPRFGWQVGIRLAGCASLLLPGLVLALLLPGGITLELDAQTAQLVSLPDPSQNPAAGGGVDSLVPSLSPDSRYVLFSSAAGNLLKDIRGI